MDATALFKFSSGLYVVSADDGERPRRLPREHGAPGHLLAPAGLRHREQGELHLRRSSSAQVTLPSRWWTSPPTCSSWGALAFAPPPARTSSTASAAPWPPRGTRTPPSTWPRSLRATWFRPSTWGTHLTFVGEVVDAGNLSEVTPMTYAYYHGTLKGKTPPKASSYVGGIR